MRTVLRSISRTTSVKTMVGHRPMYTMRRHPCHVENHFFNALKIALFVSSDGPQETVGSTAGQRGAFGHYHRFRRQAGDERRNRGFIDAKLELVHPGLMIRG